MSGINHTPLAQALGQAKQSITAAAGLSAKPKKTLWLSAYQVEGDGNPPGYARWSPTPEQLTKVFRMAHLCQDEGISEIRLSEGPDAWGANPDEIGSYEFHAGLSDAQMVITRDRLWFRDKPSHDVPIETRVISLEELSDAMTGNEEHVLFDLGNDRVSLQERIIEAGDEKYPYRNLCADCGEIHVAGEGEVFCSDCEGKPENKGDTDN